MSKKYQVNNKFLAAVLQLIEFTDCALAFHDEWEKSCAEEQSDTYHPQQDVFDQDRAYEDYLDRTEPSRVKWTILAELKKLGYAVDVVELYEVERLRNLRGTIRICKSASEDEAEAEEESEEEGEERVVLDFKHPTVRRPKS